MNQNRALSAIVPRKFFEEGKVSGGVEDGVLLVMETGPPKFNGPQDLNVLPLSRDRDLRRKTDAAPGGVQGGVLSKAGFVGEDQRPVLGLGFFLRFG